MASSADNDNDAIGSSDVDSRRARPPDVDDPPDGAVDDADDDDPASIIASINSTNAPASSAAPSVARATASQRTAAEAYMAAPTPERWRALVRSMAEEERRRRGRGRSSSGRSSSGGTSRRSGRSGKSGTTSSRSSRSSRSGSRSPAPGIGNADGDSAGVGEEGGFPSSVEFPTPPRSIASRLSVIEEDDGNASMPSDHTGNRPGAWGDAELEVMERGAPIDGDVLDRSPAECEELELIAADSEEEVYEEEGSEGQSATGSRGFELPEPTVLDFEGLKQTASFEEEDSLHEGDDEGTASLGTIEELANSDRAKEGPANQSKMREENDSVADHESDNAKEDAEIADEDSIPISVEDIIADLNKFMESDSSYDGSGSLGPRSTNASSEGTYRGRTGGWDERTLVTPLDSNPRTLTPAPFVDGSEGSSSHPAEANLTHGAKPANRMQSEGRRDDAAPVRGDDEESRKVWWNDNQYIPFGLLLSFVAALALGISLNSNASADGGRNESSKIRIVMSSLQPSSSRTPTRTPSLRPSNAPTLSSPPSTHLSALPWEHMGPAINGELPRDCSGWSTALSSDGTIVAVGAPGCPLDADDRPGHVRVYRRDRKAWFPLGAAIEGARDGDRFGRSAALSSDGTTLAIGAPGGRVGGSSRPGYVRVYVLEERRAIGRARWVQVGGDLSGEAPGDATGASVALSADGGTLAVGARGGGVNGTAPGLVRAYRLDGARWERVGPDVVVGSAAADDGPVTSLDLSADGRTLAAGVPSRGGNGVDDAGRARVYRLGEDGTGWAQLGEDVDGAAARDRSGRSVSLAADGRALAVGADGGVGVYHLEDSPAGPTWRRVGQEIAAGGARGEQSGIAVDLSADGMILAVGANGGTGASSATARVYRLEGSGVDSRWERLGRCIDGAAAGDNAGYSMALSAAGDVTAFGSPWHSGNGDKSGQVRVFHLE